MNTEEFLTAILPSQGIYCMFIKQPAQNYFYSSIKDLAESIEATQAENKIDLYHACASYQSVEGGRTAANVKLVRSMWFDIDVGKDKKGPHYNTLLEAWAALKKFIVAVKLPKPIIVKSGGGLHVYWPYGADIEPSKALDTMVKLKELAKHYELAIDPTRTADLASVLRPVGTFNFKYDPPREVSLVGL